MQRLGMMLMLVAGCLLAVGCARSEEGHFLPRNLGPGLVSQEHGVLAEIPTPIGFRLIESRSRSWTAEGNLYGEYLYQGWSKTPDTATFYRKQMLTKGWTFFGEQVEGKSAVLQFSKGSTAAAVSIIQQGSTVSVWIQTKRPVG